MMLMHHPENMKMLFSEQRTALTSPCPSLARRGVYNLTRPLVGTEGCSLYTSDRSLPIFKGEQEGVVIRA